MGRACIVPKPACVTLDRPTALALLDAGRYLFHLLALAEAGSDAAAIRAQMGRAVLGAAAALALPVPAILEMPQNLDLTWFYGEASGRR